MGDIGVKCLIDGCDSIGVYRGLCTRHYNITQKKVREGRITWDELERKGLAKPYIRNARGQLNPKRSK